MKAHLVLIGLSSALIAGCGGDSSAPKKDGGSSSGNPLTAPVDYLEAVNKGKKTAENTIDVTSVGTAVQSFLAVEGRLPKDLEELVATSYLKQVPKDRYGRKLVYDAKTGKVSVEPNPPPAK